MNSYYSYGSSAFNLEVMEKMHKEQSINANRKKQIANKKSQQTVLSIIAIAFILAFVVLYRNALIIQKSDAADKLQAQLTHLQSQNAQTEMKLKEKRALDELENNFDTIYDNSNESNDSNNDIEKETFFDDTISIEEPNEPSFIPEELSSEESTNKIEQELEEELNKVLSSDTKSNNKNSSKKKKKKKKQKDYTVIDDEETVLNVEPDPFRENILLFSEKNNNIILPFSTEDLEEFFTNNPSKYSSMQDIIDKEYTLPYDVFKNPASARFKETYYLAKHKSNLSVSKATALASELYFNSQVDPVIIRACKNIDELYSYLACLERNHLDEFKYFKIVYN